MLYIFLHIQGRFRSQSLEFLSKIVLMNENVPLETNKFP